MAKFTKAILSAKTHHSPDGEVAVTPERLKHWADTHQLMQSRRWHSSVHFDHTDDPSLQQLVQMGPKGKPKRGAMNAVGRCIDFKLAPDGQSAEITLDLPDTKATEKARQNVVEVSPVIKSTVTDGDKNTYRDCIVSYDLVTQPVDNSQSPFKEVTETIACSLRMIDDEGKGKTYRLGFGDDDSDEPEGDEDPTDIIPEAEAGGDENDDMPKAQGDDKIAEAVRAHLDILGAALPADWSFKSDAADVILLTALKTLVKAQQKAEAEKPDENDDDSFGDDDMGKVADPGYAAMSLKANNALAYVEREHRNGINARLDSLVQSGQCTAAEQAKRAGDVTAIRLSLNESGEPQLSDLEKWIESREAVPHGTFWTPEQRTANSTQRMSIVEPGSHQSFNADSDADENGRKLAGVAKKK